MIRIDAGMQLISAARETQLDLLPLSLRRVIAQLLRQDFAFARRLLQRRVRENNSEFIPPNTREHVAVADLARDQL